MKKLLVAVLISVCLIVGGWLSRPDPFAADTKYHQFKGYHLEKYQVPEEVCDITDANFAPWRRTVIHRGETFTLFTVIGQSQYDSNYACQALLVKYTKQEQNGLVALRFDNPVGTSQYVDPIFLEFGCPSYKIVRDDQVEIDVNTLIKRIEMCQTSSLKKL